MEKKIPEKKVVMKNTDIFYVYEKRINKCIREDCEGVVKYGLIIKVELDDKETINCFECNKCHMKYTPYPNYNRLTNKELSNIYNADEVAEWCERTQRKVNNRNALKLKKPFARQNNRKIDGRAFAKKGAGFKKDNYQKPETYQKRDGYQSGDGYQRKEGFQSRDGYQRKEGFQNRDGYRRKEGFLNKEGYSNSRGGYKNRYASNGYKTNTAKTFTVKKGSIISTGSQKSIIKDRKRFDEKRKLEESD